MMMCRDVVDAADVESLTAFQKLMYRFHMHVCPACQAHQKQVDTTVATLAAMPKDEPSEDAREKALAAFRKNKK
jgi:hypothetical protein